MSATDGSVDILNYFKEPITIANAYAKFLKQLNIFLQCCDLFTLKAALIDQARTPDGVKLDKPLENEIEKANSNSELLYTIRKSQCCNWLDTRLIELLAYISDSSSALELIKAYQNYLSPKKLLEVLPKKHEHVQQRRDYVVAVHAKTKMDPEKITVGEFIKYRWTIEDVVLDLGKGILNIDHVKEGCLEIDYLMPVYCAFNAYKMILHNCHKFYSIDLMHIQIGKHPLIYDPWLSDLEKDSVKQIFTQHDGKLSYYYIMFLL